MTLQVFASRISYAGPDRLDITRKSAGPDGLVFAPSWAILRPALAARAEASYLVEAAREGRYNPVEGPVDAQKILGEAWDDYVPAFLAEMRQSYRRARAAWDALLGRERVVLVCYCSDPSRCHRTILRSLILPRCGAVDGGELG